MVYKYLFEFNSVGYIPHYILLDHIAILILRTCHTVFHSAVPFYTSISTVQKVSISLHLWQHISRLFKSFGSFLTKVLFFFLVAEALDTFWIFNPYQTHDLQLFSILSVAFSLYRQYLTAHKVLNFDQSSI